MTHLDKIADLWVFTRREILGKPNLFIYSPKAMEKAFGLSSDRDAGVLKLRGAAFERLKRRK